MMRRWWHIPRGIHVQESRLSTSSQYLQLRRRPKPILKNQKDSLKAVAKPWKSPSQSIQPKQQHTSFRQDISSLVAARWNRTRIPSRIAFIAVVAYICGVEIVYHFYLEHVPITGRKRLSWTSEPVLQELDDLDRQLVEEIMGNREKGRVKKEGPVFKVINSIIDRWTKASGLEYLMLSSLRKLEEIFGRWVGKLRADKEKGSEEERGADKANGSMEVDGPALEMIISVLNRLVKAGGLEEMAWEVRVTNKPSM